MVRREENIYARCLVIYSVVVVMIDTLDLT